MILKNSKKAINIPLENIILEGDLSIPQEAKSIIIFAHGSGSSRHSTRNIYVADTLNQEGFGTLLFDLLTQEEDTVYKNRFNIFLLAKRLKLVTEWLLNNKKNNNFKIGYFGASTGAAAAVYAACELGGTISVIVSRGGRVDMVKHYLRKLYIPTLLIVGENDSDIIELNKISYDLIKGEKELSIVSNAGHLFEEPGTLEKVAELATNWFKKYLKGKIPI